VPAPAEARNKSVSDTLDTAHVLGVVVADGENPQAL